VRLDRQAWRFIAVRYAPWLAALSLAWELAQLPLYTLWKEATPGYIAFAVAHCTTGDLLIGVAALLIGRILGREEAFGTRTLLWMLILAPGYTLFSEWLNTTLGRWAYSDLMPTVRIAGLVIGLSPLLQWLVIPPLALHLAKKRIIR
jgi:hypothetical protein